MQEIEFNNRRLLVLAGKTTASADSILKTASELAGEGAAVRILDASRIFGMDHLIAGFRKAVRAFEQGVNLSESLATETMVYLSGCRQIQESLAMIGLREGVSSIVCLADDTLSIRAKLAEELQLNEDESVILANGKMLCHLGINELELGTVLDDKRLDLVLERVAGVDIRKK